MTPTARVGILGGGQLARMLALAGHRLGIECRVVSDREWACAAPVTSYTQVDLADPDALAAALGDVDVVTYEVEHLPADAVEALAARVPVRPGIRALRVGQDRGLEKQALEALGIPVAPWRMVDSAADLRAAAGELRFPLVLKTRRDGFDGRGQSRLVDAAALAARVEAGDLEGCVAEGWVEFEREVSLVAVRGTDGAFDLYPMVENHHEEGQLDTTLAPAPGVEPALAAEAGEWIRRLLEDLEYVGVLALELFLTPAGLVANELAPRVHNSGHWSQDGAVTDQFENHLRAILGWPLGSCAPRGATVMINLLGEVPATPALLADPDARVHLYGKSPRPARKLGHVNLVGEDLEDLTGRSRAIRAPGAEVPRVASRS